MNTDSSGDVLRRIVRRIPEIVQSSAAMAPEFTLKNHLIRGSMEFCGRLVYASFGWNFAPGQSVHYYHDPRYSRFNPPGVVPFATKYRSLPPLKQFSPLFALRVVWCWLSISLRLFPRNLTFTNFMLHLAVLDLACIWTLVRYRKVSHFYVTAHFNPYVFLIGELRREGAIAHFSGTQHGAWGLRSLSQVHHDVPYDDYTLLEERFLKPFRQYFDRGGLVKINIRDHLSRPKWQQYDPPHIAVALQNDDYENDLKITKNCHDVAQRFGIDLIIYPHPTAPEKIVNSFAPYGRLTRTERYGNSLCMVTRYSTLALDFATHGKTGVFVDVGERLVFDTDGLDVRFTTLNELSEELDSILKTSPVCEQGTTADCGR